MALSNAERQRLYREKRKTEGKHQQSFILSSEILTEINKHRGEENLSDFIERMLWQAFASPGEQNETPDKTDILDLAKQIRPGDGHLIPVHLIRQEVNMSKQEFDTEILRLAQAEKVWLHRHVFPSPLSDAEKEELIEQDGDFFMGIVIR
ncbi:MAG: hypothetical protein GY749_48215 [Desulfobacteraceae bacterium]|nr:hypothetical protein [Desulfobacteraceae bacterium]